MATLHPTLSQPMGEDMTLSTDTGGKGKGVYPLHKPPPATGGGGGHNPTFPLDLPITPQPDTGGGRGELLPAPYDPTSLTNQGRKGGILLSTTR